MNKKYHLNNITRQLADALAIVLAYLAALMVHFGNIGSGFSLIFLGLSLVFWIFLSQISKLYANRRSNKFSEEIIFIAYHILLLSILVSSSLYFVRLEQTYSLSFFIVYLTLLLADRAWRDDARCADKYGPYWKTYCRKVPFKIVPGVI